MTCADHLMAEEAAEESVSVVSSNNFSNEEFEGLGPPASLGWTGGNHQRRAVPCAVSRGSGAVGFAGQATAHQHTAELGQDDLVRNLVKALVHRVTELTGARTCGDQPLIDCLEAGVRCVLVRARPDREGTAGLLSPREREIAGMVGLGHTNKAIADVLKISLYTVSAHLRRIFAKLDVQSRAAMVAVLSSDRHLFSVDAEPVRGRERRGPSLR
jgi:DNA-binding CsgD family transcriptional regulator